MQIKAILLIHYSDAIMPILCSHHFFVVVAIEKNWVYLSNESASIINNLNCLESNNECMQFCIVALNKIVILPCFLLSDQIPRIPRGVSR